MTVEEFMACDPNEKPLDRLTTDGGFCGIFRTIACVGDSLASGEHEGTGAEGQKTYHDFYDYSWGQYLARMAGCTVHNFSRGGMSAKWYLDSFAEEKGWWDPALAAQAYIIALGVNDLNPSSELEVGSVTDICDTDPTRNKPTFAGYYGRIIQQYKAIQPKAKFFFLTMPRGSRDEKNEKRDAHAALLYELTEHFENSYVIDLRKYGPIYDNSFRAKFYLGGHMNAAGYLLTGQMVASYIDYIIRHNMEDFKQVGFIGTPFENATK